MIKYIKISLVPINRDNKKKKCFPERDLSSRPLVYETSALTTELPRLIPHRGQTSGHAREIALGIAVTTAASSYELEAKYSFYFIKFIGDDREEEEELMT